MTFTANKAVRKNVPLLLGLMGPSGGGKTYSALRLSKGIQSVVGGDVYYIDTEADRALHYADQFDFYHVPFGPPFSPKRYLEAIQYCVQQGAKVIVVDSMSHEHEGEGGVLDMHDQAVKKMGGERHSFRAWAKPKAERQALINGILQLRCSFVFCFRAKEKTSAAKDPKTGDLKRLGWMAIAGDAFVYEMTACALLPPGVNGVPEWNPEREGERAMVKQPSQFRELFAAHRGKPLSEDMGAAMARWASGGSLGAPTPAEPAEYRIPKGRYKGMSLPELDLKDLALMTASMKSPSKTRDLFMAEFEKRVAEAHPDALLEILDSVPSDSEVAVRVQAAIEKQIAKEAGEAPG